MSTPLRVLMLVDQQEDAERIDEVLRQAGFLPEWRCVATRVDYLAHVSEGFDLLIANDNLAQFDATQALPLLQTRGLDLPYLVLAEAASVEAAVEWMTRGAADYLPKHDLSRLGPAVTRALQAQKRRAEQRQAEDALRASEERHRSMIESVHDLLCELDKEGRALYLSPNHYEVLGYELDELLGRSVFELIHPDDLPIVLAAFATGVGEVAYRFRHKDNSWRWLESTGKTHFTAKGEFRGVVVSRDITERKRVEDALQESLTLLEKAQEVAHLGSWISEPEQTGALVWSSSTHEIFGLPERQFDGKTETFFAMVHPEDREAVRQASASAMSTGEPYSIDHRIIRPDGSMRWVHERAAVLRDQHGDPVRMIGIVQDITERKRTEQLLRDEGQVSTALARVGRELIASLDVPTILNRLCQLTAEVLGCDASQTFLWQPEREVFCSVAGYGNTPEQWESLKVFLIPAAVVAEGLDRLKQEDVIQITPAEEEERWIARIAKRYGVTSLLIMALRRGEEILGVQTAGYRRQHEPFTPQHERIARGIAQLASLALENARLLEEAEKANSLKSEFLATMSHELRTPLNVILGYTTILLDEPSPSFSAEQADLLRRVSKSAQELFELITATLDVSRLEAERMAVEVKELLLSELFEEIRTETRELQRKPNVRWEWRMAADLPVLRTDPLKLKVVLKNLLGNAAKFTDTGTVTIHASCHEGGVEICVADTGVGIPRESLSEIFEMFRQATGSSSRLRGGVGLGLYIVKRLLELLRGRVTVESEVGKGSIFRVWLPLAIEHGSPVASSLKD
ncbi:MAG: PAS domain-containing protein [Candidatus Binatia bacterium]